MNDVQQGDTPVPLYQVDHTPDFVDEPKASPLDQIIPMQTADLFGRAQMPNDPRSLAPVAQRAGEYAFPYLFRPGDPELRPNAEGKTPVADPLTTPLPYAFGGIDAASYLTGEGAIKGLAGAALHLLPAMGKLAEEGLTHHIMNDVGERVADATLHYYPETKDLRVGWVGLPMDLSSVTSFREFAKNSANMLGPSEIRSLVQAAKKEFPDAETMSGMRISGARTGKRGSVSDVRVRLRGQSDDRDFKPRRDALEYEVPSGSE
jgi:hypothetical protein